MNTPAPRSTGISTTQRRRIVIGAIAIAGALGFLVVKGLGSAALYFRTADEAIERRASLGERRFRLEGIVVDGSVREIDGAVHFAVEENAVQVQVVHRGDPPDLFQCNIPVVLEGRFSKGTDVFASDRILVKHSESYAEANPARLKEYVGKDKFRCVPDGQAPAGPAAVPAPST